MLSYTKKYIMFGTEILIVLFIIAIAKLLQVINNEDNILKVKTKKNSYEEDLLLNADKYINKFFSESNEYENYIHNNIVMKETLNQQIDNNIVTVNLHSINRMTDKKTNKIYDIDITWKFSKKLSDEQWIIASVHISDPSADAN